MKIAYVVPYVPNLIRTRPYNLIVHLAALGNEVTVFTLGSGQQDLKDVEVLRSKVKQVYYQEQPVWYSLWNGVKVLLSRRPLQTVYSWNLRLAKQLVSLLSVPGTFDVVHVEHLRGSLYGQYIKQHLPHIPVVWDSVDCISYLFKQASTHSTGGFGKFVTRFELGRTEYMEGKLVGEFDHVLVTSETDKNALLELAAPASKVAPISVLSNGVDLEYFHPNPDGQREDETLVFSGKMSYHANISMVKYLVSEIMPRVWAKRPQVKLVIVGKDPTPEIRAFGTDPRIVVTGTVDDIRPFLWKATAAVVPLVYGAGIQNKVLEAMACETPVITTSKTLSSLHVTSGKDILVADSADEFSQTILTMLDNQVLRSKVGVGGGEYVREHHSWVAMAKQILGYYSGKFKSIVI
jgi:glycosyltransferase involved in cell wall biosynthesis